MGISQERTCKDMFKAHVQVQCASHGEAAAQPVNRPAAGALSMAAGEYISVSSQRDTEQADIQKEREQQEKGPEVRPALPTPIP